MSIGSFIKDYGALVAVVFGALAGVATFSSLQTEVKLLSGEVRTLRDNQPISLSPRIDSLENVITTRLSDKEIKNKIDSTFNNHKQSLASMPVGAIIPFAGSKSNIPKDWKLCDGRPLQVSEYEELYEVIQASWGGQQDTYFNLPDLSGKFLRGVDHNNLFDIDSNSRTAIKKGGNIGNKVGSYQGDSTKIPNSNFKIAENYEHSHSSGSLTGSTTKNGKHAHLYKGFKNVQKGDGKHTKSRKQENDNAEYGGEVAGDHSHNLLIQGNTSANGSHTHKLLGGDSETRPINVSVNWIIKVK